MLIGEEIFVFHGENVVFIVAAVACGDLHVDIHCGRFGSALQQVGCTNNKGKSDQFQISSCSLTRNITPHSMNNMIFDSLLR